MILGNNDLTAIINEQKSHFSQNQFKEGLTRIIYAIENAYTRAAQPPPDRTRGSSNRDDYDVYEEKGQGGGGLTLPNIPYWVWILIVLLVIPTLCCCCLCYYCKKRRGGGDTDQPYASGAGGGTGGGGGGFMSGAASAVGRFLPSAVNAYRNRNRGGGRRDNRDMGANQPMYDMSGHGAQTTDKYGGGGGGGGSWGDAPPPKYTENASGTTTQPTKKDEEDKGAGGTW